MKHIFRTCTALVLLVTVCALLFNSAAFAAPNVVAPVLMSETKLRLPTASGTKISSNSLAVIDYSNAAQGYVMIKYSGNVGKIKVIIQKSGGIQYRYDLVLRGSYEVFPLTSGSGIYSVGIYENVSGTQYAEALSTSVNAEITNSLSPYLYPNQYVNFNKDSKTVAKSNDLAKNMTKELDIVANVYDYVVNNISYDTQKAATVQTIYPPNGDSTLALGKGICFDYASLMASMLRAQGIPTRVEVGLVSGGTRHAWISVYTKEVGWVNNVIQFDGKTWKLMDPTFASTGGQASAIMKYIGDGKNYTVQNYY